MTHIATAALIARCREVLGISAGSRPIDPYHIRPEFHVGLTDREASLRALVNPRYDVRVSRIQKMDARGVESVSTYSVEVEVLCAYHLETIHRLSASTRDGVYGLAFEDSDRITQAFGYEANLSRTADGRMTWLAGGVLLPLSYKMEGDIGDPPNRQFRLALTYHGTVTVPNEDASDISGIAGLFTYLRADLGVSATAVSATDPQLLSSANWTKVGVTVDASPVAANDGTLTAWAVRETAATSVRYLRQDTIGTSVQGLMSFSVEVYGPDNKYAFVGNVADDVYQTFDLLNQRKGSISRGLISSSITPLSTGWFRLSVTWRCKTSASMYFGMSTTDSVSSYAGSVARYMHFANPTLTEYEMVTAWADQSGGNHHFVQATAVQQPRFLESALLGDGGALNGRSCLWMGGASAGRIYSNATAAFDFMHTGTGGTITMAVNKQSNGAGVGSSYYFDNVSGANIPGIQCAMSTTNQVTAYILNGAGPAGVTVQAYPNSNQALFFKHASGVNGVYLEINGRSATNTQSAPSATTAANPLSIGTPQVGSSLNAFVGEFRAYNVAVSAANLALIRRYYQSRYGTP